MAAGVTGAQPAGGQAPSRRDRDGYPDCPKCWGNGVVVHDQLGPPATAPCPTCHGSKRGCYDHTITDDVRLGAVRANLTLASRLIRDAVKASKPPGSMAQALDHDEHPGYWLTRKQVYDAVQASSEIERIWRELELRIARDHGAPAASGEGSDRG